MRVLGVCDETGARRMRLGKRSTTADVGGRGVEEQRRICACRSCGMVLNWLGRMCEKRLAAV